MKCSSVHSSIRKRQTEASTVEAKAGLLAILLSGIDYLLSIPVIITVM